MRFFQLLACHKCIESREHRLRDERGIMVDDSHLPGTAKKHWRANIGMGDHLQVTPDVNTKFVKGYQCAVGHQIVPDDQPIGPRSGWTLEDLPGQQIALLLE